MDRIMKKMIFSVVGLMGMITTANAQYDDNFVEMSVTSFQGDKIGVIDINRDQNRVKVKYFAGKDFNGTSVYERYRQWSRGKNIVAYSSGTYMDGCEASLAKPVGICIDNGRLVNNVLEPNRFDGLAIVYSSGGIAVSNLKEKNLQVTNCSGGGAQTLNIRDAFDKSKFVQWAADCNATVFQTHLFYFKNNFLVNTYSTNTTQAKRRFLAVGKDENGILHHYIVNINTPHDITTGTQKAVNFLKNAKSVQDLIFLINLDTGCQDVFEARKANGNIDTREYFKGTTDISNASNLLVYYYE